jgi:hypothetical protein
MSLASRELLLVCAVAMVAVALAVVISVFVQAGGVSRRAIFALAPAMVACIALLAAWREAIFYSDATQALAQVGREAPPILNVVPGAIGDSVYIGTAVFVLALMAVTIELWAIMAPSSGA